VPKLDEKNMKTLFALVALCVITVTAHGQTHTVSYDWKAHNDRIDVLFYEYAPVVLKEEREKMEAILPPEKADQYMKWFEKGLHSNTGIVKIEGSANRWLEIAVRAAYAQKVLFRRAYFEGLRRKAEIEE
jgi:hypothetical protein